MSLVLKLAYYVSPAVRQQGAMVFGRGALMGATSGDNWLRTRVKGSSGQTYRVELKREESVINAKCTCALFMKEGVCKHIWATILWGDSTGLDDVLKAEPMDVLKLKTPTSNAIVDKEDGINGEGETRRRWDHDESAADDAELAAKSRLGSDLEHRLDEWQDRIDAAKRAALRPPEDVWQTQLDGDRLLYLLDSESSPNVLKVELAQARMRKDGIWGQRSHIRLSLNDLDRDPRLDDDDRRILGLLSARQGLSTNSEGSLNFLLHRSTLNILIPLLCNTDRFFLQPKKRKAEPLLLKLDPGRPWLTQLEVKRVQGKDEEVNENDETPKDLIFDGFLEREREKLDPSQIEFLADGGWFIYEQSFMRYSDPDANFRWLRLLRVGGAVYIPHQKRQRLIEKLYSIGLPHGIKWEDKDLEPRFDDLLPVPHLEILAGIGEDEEQRIKSHRPLLLHFAYKEEKVAADDPVAALHDDTGRILIRNRALENAAIERLREFGARPTTLAEGVPGVGLEISPLQIDPMIYALAKEGWKVKTDGVVYRSMKKMKLSVDGTGIDWFDLSSTVQFDQQEVALPQLLKALDKGNRSIQLKDGSYGILPEDWLKRYGLLLAAGEVVDDKIRFSAGQIALLDALLADREFEANDAFTEARARLEHFSGKPEPIDAPKGFKGSLRPYQQEGLGWLGFLNELKLGGCLADDMGLGKTVQALAYFQGRKNKSNGKKRTSLVIVPKSLVHNWYAESKTFTPDLVVHIYSGAKRDKDVKEFGAYDIIITTYGTLRRDILMLQDFVFDTILLDEAQAIKNASSQSAKAARLLKGETRIALSGTPVENRISELWSLYSFLQPGLLGQSTNFSAAMTQARSGKEAVEELSAVLRPLLLRRTKEQVAPDLPPRLQQVLYCELEGQEAELYQDLKAHYRKALLETKKKVGSKVEILEGLLRLRQAACHPGLVDKKYADQSSAKIDLLMERLEIATSDGHKALVFSQFTSLLALLRKRLDAENVSYEYLDGKTRNRQKPVERFQSDPECSLFLISLKAGGFGLNLTAADYVFLLDPWWNPAVEAQAIDRTHRIGQTRPVFAYRLIAKDSVEEKVLLLQERKESLAKAIFSGAANMLKDLTREDLEHLLT